MKKYTMLKFAILLTALFLTACSNKTEKTQTQKLPSIVNERNQTTFFEPSNQFSIKIPGTWSETNGYVALPVNRSTSLSLSSDNNLLLSLNRLKKADIALDLPGLARYLTQQSRAKDILPKPTFSTSTVAGRTGLLLMETATLGDSKHSYSFFLYEDGDYYKFITVEAPENQQADTLYYTEKALESWTDQATSPKNYTMTQQLNLANSNLTLSIPSEWNLKSSENGSNIYVSSIDDARLVLFSDTTVGYTVDLADYANQYAQQIGQENTVSPVTVGDDAGYLIQYQEVADAVWNTSVNVYIFHINETIINLVFASPSSEVEALRPTMEAIVLSIQ